jgi:hypothetical protein
MSSLLLLLLLLLLLQAAIIINMMSCHNYHRYLYLLVFSNAEDMTDNIQHRTMFSGCLSLSLSLSLSLYETKFGHTRQIYSLHYIRFQQPEFCVTSSGIVREIVEGYKFTNKMKNSECSSKHRDKVCPAIETLSVISVGCQLLLRLPDCECFHRYGMFRVQKIIRNSSVGKKGYETQI